MISDEFSKDEVRFLPPTKRTCPICADKHFKHEPHNRNSLYYQMMFFREHGRLPRWADALEDTSEMMRAYWMGEMKKKGVRPEEISANGR